MKKIIKTLTIATFLTSIPLTGILVNHYHSPAKDSLTNHQVEMNLKAPELQIADPTYQLELTPFNNPAGVNNFGLIMLSLDIDQIAIQQVSEVNVGIGIEDDTTIWTKIYGGGFTDITELNLSYGFTELANKVYTIDVVIKLADSDSPEIALSEQVEIANDELPILEVNKDTMVINPTMNEDGTVTYKIGSIQVRLMATTQRMFDFSKVDATNAMFKIFYNHDIFEPVALNYDQDLATATSSEEITIPKVNVDSGYLIVLTGIIYDLVPVGAIEVIRSIEIGDESDGSLPPAISREPITGINITKLVIGSVVTLTLLGMGLSWAIKD